MAIILGAYDPYKDVFDIFIEQFKKNWPDCPYPLVISNMYFKYEGDNVILINCGEEKDASVRYRKAYELIDADYYLGFEEDRIIMDKVDTAEVEKVLDFMDKEQIPFFRCNASSRKKREVDRFKGYDHYYHIPAKEPYGVCGSTAIKSKKMVKYLTEKYQNNGYKWEAAQNKRAALTKKKWAYNYATYDKNLFHILHCVEKQKWIRSSKKELIKNGFTSYLNKRETQSIKEAILMNIKELFIRIPGKTRYYIKKLLTKLGLKFVTEY